MHKPWWQYYYIHNAIPLCWLAALGIHSVAKVRSPVVRSPVVQTPVVSISGVLFLTFAFALMAGRVYLQISAIRHCDRTYTALVLKEIERFKPFTTFMFADRPVYSFHAGIPIVPDLAVIPLKRFWAGEMTNARLIQDLETAKPGLILVLNDGRDLPYQDLLTREYRLVYYDRSNRLFAHTSIAKKPRF